MADLSNKKDELSSYNSIMEGLSDNTDLIDLVEMSEESETNTLDQIESDLKKTF